MAVTREQLKWILDNHESATSASNLADLFNKKFNTNIAYIQSINKWLDKLREEGNILRLHWRVKCWDFKHEEPEHCINLTVDTMIKHDMSKVSDLLANNHVLADMAEILGRHKAHVVQFIRGNGIEITKRHDEKKKEIAEQPLPEQPIMDTIKAETEPAQDTGPPQEVTPEPVNEPALPELHGEIQIMRTLIMKLNPHSDNFSDEQITGLCNSLLTCKGINVINTIGASMVTLTNDIIVIES